ncbi:M1 family metallopeptidase [Actinomycetospora cinnamomea]|uniref:Peptidase M1-like protein n=1 Tax=Actinomycetospora cinnamomea TaxID=663609 RepID=A0A2U1F642_9PSEU|nr:M1 family metallopeptidase [Actinomycetospora cinnamomea]PVZ07653.1 peptidase M1-like protein [Actinomycetospora cinnamomea]
MTGVPRRRAGRRVAALVGALLLLALAACGSEGPPPRPDEGAWDRRPVVDLAFDVPSDLETVTGRETVAFTPDLAVCELVFRAWPNSPSPARQGNSLTVTGASVDGRPVAPVVRRAGAAENAPGTLVELPLPACVPAGTTVRAELAFTLRLGEDADERLGTSPSTRTAWWGSGYPLLAWVRGEGWAREDAVDIAGETATSEDFRLASLRVTTPNGVEVAGTGQPAGAEPGPRPGTTTHRFTAEAVRDVAVAVGRYQVLERDLGGTRLHLFTPVDGTRVPPEQWADIVATATERLVERFGPFPYPDLWVAVAPAQSSGIEFPTALQFGDTGEDALPALATHELAHQWFYGLVGNNQARDPWIDEAFATYAEELIAGDGDGPQDVPDRLDGDLGESMAFWGERSFGAYYRGVYQQGAAALLAAREDAGPERFDAAVRDYLAANAHQVVSPAEVAAAFRDLPEVTDRLRDAGALPAR